MTPDGSDVTSFLLIIELEVDASLDDDEGEGGVCFELYKVHYSMGTSLKRSRCKTQTQNTGLQINLAFRLILVVINLILISSSMCIMDIMTIVKD